MANRVEVILSPASDSKKLGAWNQNLMTEWLEIEVPRKAARLPDVPTEEELKRFYQAVWSCRNFADMVLIKTLFYRRKELMMPSSNPNAQLPLNCS